MSERDETGSGKDNSHGPQSGGVEAASSDEDGAPIDKAEAAEDLGSKSPVASGSPSSAAHSEESGEEDSPRTEEMLPPPLAGSPTQGGGELTSALAMMSRDSSDTPDIESSPPEPYDEDVPRADEMLPPPVRPAPDSPLPEPWAPDRPFEQESLGARTPWISPAEKVSLGVWYGGGVLWTYVVLGEYVVGAGLPEFLAWSVFVGVLVFCFLKGANRAGPQMMGKIASLAVLSVIGLLLLITTLLGSSVRSEYQSVSVLLLLLSLVATLGGAHRVRRYKYFGQLTPKLGWAQVALLVVLAGNTLLMLAAFASQM